VEPTEMGRIVYGYADEIFGLGRELLDVLHGAPTGRSQSCAPPSESQRLETHPCAGEYHSPPASANTNVKPPRGTR